MSNNADPDIRNLASSKKRKAVLRGEKKAYVVGLLVPYLLDNPCSVAEVAAHFEIDPDVIRWAVTTVATSELPFDGNGIYDADLFVLDWDAFDNDEIILSAKSDFDRPPKFTGEQATMLSIGLQYLASMPDTAEIETIEALRQKLARGSMLPPSEVHVSPLTDPLAVAPIREAQRKGLQLNFRYQNADGAASERVVDPLELISRDSEWWLSAYCHTKNDLRKFRLDRMLEVSVSPAQANAHPEFDSNTDLYTPSATDIEVTVVADKAVEELFAERFRAQPGGRPGEFTILVSQAQVAARVIASYGGAVRVISPDHVRESVLDWAHRGLAQYAG